ncbi:putative membrane protein, partial [Chlamydia psittaci 10_743_SC13]
LCLPFGSALLLAQRSFGFALTIPFIKFIFLSFLP